MSTAQARAEFGLALRERLPAFVVFPNPNDFHESTQPVLFFERTGVERHPQMPQGARLNEFTLFVIAPVNSGEDALDEALDDVLDALDDVSLADQGKAIRALYNGQYPCWSITLTTTSIHSQQ